MIKCIHFSDGSVTVKATSEIYEALINRKLNKLINQLKTLKITIGSKDKNKLIDNAIGQIDNIRLHQYDCNYHFEIERNKFDVIVDSKQQVFCISKVFPSHTTIRTYYRGQ